VAVGQQADDQPLGQIILADDDLAEFVKQRMRERARFLDRFVDGVDSCAHMDDHLTKFPRTFKRKSSFSARQNFRLFFVRRQPADFSRAVGLDLHPAVVPVSKQTGSSAPSRKVKALWASSNGPLRAVAPSDRDHGDGGVEMIRRLQRQHRAGENRQRHRKSRCCA
jgi:hypothetical protein